MNNNTVIYKLNNGEDIYIRLLTPEDRLAVEEGFKKLSEETKRLRFLQSHESLSSKELDYLTNIDNLNHVAFCAYKNEHNKDIGIGIVRYIRSIKNPATAEIAITITDEYQGKVIGKQLIKAITKHALKNGVTKFAANAFYFNDKILNIIEKTPYKITGSEDGILQIEINLNTK